MGIISTNVLCPRRIATSDHRARVWRSLGLALFSARGSDQADREGIIEPVISITGDAGGLGELSRTPYYVGGLQSGGRGTG
jgi:hypothetical protein